jgi:hypothetical protein
MPAPAVVVVAIDDFSTTAPHAAMPFEVASGVPGYRAAASSKYAAANPRCFDLRQHGHEDVTRGQQKYNATSHENFQYVVLTDTDPARPPGPVLARRQLKVSERLTEYHTAATAAYMPLEVLHVSRFSAAEMTDRTTITNTDRKNPQTQRGECDVTPVGATYTLRYRGTAKRRRAHFAGRYARPVAYRNRVLREFIESLLSTNEYPRFAAGCTCRNMIYETTACKHMLMYEACAASMLGVPP